MSKTITIAQDATHHIIHVERFAVDAEHIRRTGEFGSTWSHTWLRAGLIAFTDNGDVELTPRGEDLLASAAFLQDNSKPEVRTTPCSKCNGSGEQPLFVSMETCSRCDGSKVEPDNPLAVLAHAIANTTTTLRRDEVPKYEVQVTSGRISYKRPNSDTLPRLGYSAFIYPAASGDVIERASEHPWVLIDSEEVVQQFVGKRVEIDAPANQRVPPHTRHGCTRQIVRKSTDRTLWLADSMPIDWRARGNVRLRLVDGDPS